jgi:hypothetical protein
MSTSARLRFILSTAIAFAMAALSACGSSRSIGERAVGSGKSVAALVAESDTAVILLFKPSDVFVCSGALQPWLEWRRSHPHALALVFTREPTAAERTQLATLRVHSDGVLRRRFADAISAPETPSELLLVRGRVVSAEAIRPRVLATPLYRRLTAGSPRGASLSSAFGSR